MSGLKINDLAAYADIQDKPQGDHVREDRASAIADQRECDAGYGHHSHRHGYIFKYLESEHG